MFPPGSKVIELGGGDRPQFRPNVDIRKLPTVDIVADLGKELPIESDQYDGVFSMYSIEHVSWRQVRTFIKEMFRILKPGGRALVITANLLEQCRKIVETSEWDDNLMCMLWGDQNYENNDWLANAHHCGFSPAFAVKLFKEAGFDTVNTGPHPNCPTDLIIEAIKTMKINPSAWSTDERKKAFNRDYFDGGRGEVGGYAREGYWDYPVHWITFRKVMEMKPESVLELGPARGYILKRLEDEGIRVKGLEISEHCVKTRVVNNIVQWDLTNTPWPIHEQFDLCISNAVLEHIPEDKLPDVIREIQRVSRQGLHGVDFGEKDDGFDKTHCTLKDQEWWASRFPKEQQIVSKSHLESGPINAPGGDGEIKLNVGSFTTMFHYGWTNIDIHPLEAFAKHHEYVYRQHDVRTGLPFADNTVSLIYACHFLEHLTKEEGERFLKECFRVLKSGGTMRLLLPDAKKLIQQYLGGTLGYYDEINVGCAQANNQIEKLWSLLFSGHVSMYDSDTILKRLQESGFGRVQIQAFRTSCCQKILKETQDMYPDLSLFVDAVKI